MFIEMIHTVYPPSGKDFPQNLFNETIESRANTLCRFIVCFPKSFALLVVQRYSVGLLENSSSIPLEIANEVVFTKRYHFCKSKYHREALQLYLKDNK
ncbi:hypothetical protein V1477_015361 [Vespula maculifrons]|uniref:Uncharacterized protein n=1 Tax=Vespula maculifrons TaxID=7453 RepID=A0ABD2BGG5_VESMC